MSSKCRNESNLDALRHAVQESFRRDRANPAGTIRVWALLLLDLDGTQDMSCNVSRL
jgi:hypothetical protein